MRIILHKLCDSYATYHILAEPLATDEIIVALKGSHFQTIYVSRPGSKNRLGVQSIYRNFFYLYFNTFVHTINYFST